LWILRNDASEAYFPVKSSGFNFSIEASATY
jgi:hypothetical protein